MKRVLLVLVAACCIVLGTGAIAHAESYTGSCESAPSGTVEGSIEITEPGESGECTIEHSLYATGSITIEPGTSITVEGMINSQSGDIVLEGSDVYAQKIFSGASFGVTASGSVDIEEEVSINTGGGGGNLLITAQEEVATGSIYINEGSGGSNVEINANQGGGNNLFTIDGSGYSSNGVNGVIDMGGSSGGGADPLDVGNVLDIVNGTSASNGGITIGAEGAIYDSNSASRSGVILLQAQSGVLTLPSGNLSANGSSGQDAGYIFLLGQEVAAPSGAVLTADQEPSAAPSCHQVIIAANTVSYGGSGLEIQANGDGYEKGCGGNVYMVPKGGLEISYPSNELDAIEEVDTLTSSSSSLTVSGSGPLTVAANGKNDGVEIWGNELNLGSTGGSISRIFSEGSSDYVHIGAGKYGGSGLSTLSFVGALEVNVNTEQSSDAAGEIYVAGKEIAKPAGLVVLNTQGINGGVGGAVQLAASSGEVPLGGSGENININVSAIGGGNAGTAKVNAGAGTVEIDESTAFYASAEEGNSNGGTIEVFANAIESQEGASPTIFATGHGTGNGGKVSLHASGELNIGDEGSDLVIETAYEDSGSGGTVELSASEVNLNGGDIFVTPQKGNGGEIKVTDTGKLNVSDEFYVEANGAENGNGGTVSFEAEYIEFEGEGSEIQTNGEGEGNGGTIELNATGEGAELDLSSEEADGTTLDANGGSDSDGGDETIKAAFIIDQDTKCEEASKVSGKGGEFKAQATQEILVKTAFKCDLNGEGASGEGGKALFEAPKIKFESGASISVEANGSGTGKGGVIQFKDTGTEPLEISPANYEKLEAKGGKEGQGGSIEITKAVDDAAEEDPINVNQLFKVESGSEYNSGTTEKESGSLKLNGVECRQWMTKYSPWPKAYWNCIAPYGKRTEIAKAAHGLNASTLLPLLANDSNTPKNPEQSIFVIKNLKSWEEFFGAKVEGTKTNVGGYTPFAFRTSSVFENVLIPGGGEELLTAWTKSSSAMEATIVHELAHALQWMWGAKTQLGEEAEFETLAHEDYRNLNSISCTDIFESSTCSAYSGKTEEAFRKQFKTFELAGFAAGIASSQDGELFSELLMSIEAKASGLKFQVWPQEEKALPFLKKSYEFVEKAIASPPSVKR